VAVWRAMTASLAMTGGFVVVFGAFGLVVVPAALAVERFLPWVTVVVGLVIVVVGIWLLSGRELGKWRPARIAGGAPSTSTWSWFGYGVAYALISLSCAVAPFLALVSSTFSTSGVISGAVAFLGFALGMGVVVVILAVAAALGGRAVLTAARGALPFIARAGGALLILAGAYITYYGVYELRVFSGGDTDDAVIDGALSVQGTVSRWAADVGSSVGLEVAVVAVVVVVVVGAVIVRRRRAISRSL
jgi:cytochrome c-type biogenesis protein